METKIKKIIILEGGLNEEHKVSLYSSNEVKKIFIKKNINYKIIKVNPLNFYKIVKKYNNTICFNALHGSFGEDGQIQKILRDNKIKFTHSGINSSKLCFNKSLTKKIISKNNILTPKFVEIKVSKLDEKVLKNLKLKFKKFIIKPNKSGSSFGIFIIKSYKDLNNFLKKINKFKKDLSNHDNIIIEQFISGRELTVSTIKLDGKINSLAVTEIKPKNNFFDYQAKYSKGFSKHILPAKIKNSTYKKCLDIAKKCHKILRCNSIARTDMILSNKDNKIYFLETNTQPGLTPISLLPEQAKFKKISFDKIVDIILKSLI